MQANLTTWLQDVRAATGVMPAIVTDKAFWDSEFPSGSGLSSAGYPLWIAQYSGSSPTLPAEWSTWTFWQYSATGSVPGISGPTDLDRFNGGDLCAVSVASKAVSPTCVVPNLKGKKLIPAESAITAAGCADGTVKRPKSKGARKKAKFVVAQSPESGQTVQASQRWT